MKLVTQEIAAELLANGQEMREHAGSNQSNAQRSYSVFKRNGASPVVTRNSAHTIIMDDTASGDHDITITGQLASASDFLRVDYVEIYQAG